MQAATRMAVTLAATCALLTHSLIALAQGTQQRRPGMLDEGARGASFGNCRADMLSNDLLGAAAALGAFSPIAINRLVPANDDLTVIARYCSEQLHKHRCDAAIVAVAGDVLTTAHPGGAALPGPVNPGTIVGAAAGAAVGLLITDHPVRDTLIGTGAGALAWSVWKVKQCKDHQQKIDAFSELLAGSIPRLSVNNLNALIQDNLNQGTIAQAEAKVLVSEASKLQTHALRLLRGAR